MTLKYKYAGKGEIPADQVALYVEREGAFVLDVEGVVPREKLDEFRTNNVALQKQVSELTAKFAGIDPEAVRRLDAEKKALEEQLVSGKGSDIDKVLAVRLKPLQDQLQGLTAEREKLNRELREREVNQAVLTAGTKRGLRASAQEDILLRASRAIRSENGVLGVYDAGGRQRFGSDGVTPLSVDAWMEGLSAEAPHLFEVNAGGGASGGGSGGVANGENPWKKDTFNLTKQGQILKTDPARAKALMAAARG